MPGKCTRPVKMVGRRRHHTNAREGNESHRACPHTLWASKVRKRLLGGNQLSEKGADALRNSSYTTKLPPRGKVVRSSTDNLRYDISAVTALSPNIFQPQIIIFGSRRPARVPQHGCGQVQVAPGANPDDLRVADVYETC